MNEINIRDLRHAIPKKLAAYEKTDEGLLMTLTDGNAEWKAVLSFFRQGIVRIRLYRGTFESVRYDVVNKDMIEAEDVVISETENGLSVDFGGYTAVLGKDPYRFAVKAQDGAILYEENVRDVNSVNEGLDPIPPMGYSLDRQNNCYMNVAAKLRHDEHIYGLGEHFTEFDKRGQTVSMRNFDTLGCRDSSAYKNIPFYVSSRHYGLFIHNHGVFDFHIGSESTASVSVHVPGGSLEYYLVFGSDMSRIVSTYMTLTGPAVLPPDWSFGLWYSTGFKGNSGKAAMADARRFCEEDIPCDVMHFDCYWLRDSMWCDFVWDEAQYPCHTQMLEELKDMGFKSCLWINPYITMVSQMFAEGQEKGYFVRNEQGEVYTADLWHGLLPWCAILDFTNSEARCWFQQKIEPLLREGVSVLKTDFAEDIPYDGIFSNGLTGREMRNIYSRLYNEAVFEITEKVKGQGTGIVWARSGCAGMQRYPVCWSGDPNSSFEGMAGTLRGGLSLAMSGVPFWSHDMGGFYGDVSEDVFIRWSQFGLFSSHCRLHGTTTRQPWAYGEKAFEILRKFIRLRYRLMPYILESARLCVEQEVPFIRPLVFSFEEDPTVYGIYDEYFFGEEVLAAPVFGGDRAVREVYLPEGNWQDLLTGEYYDGKNWYTITCPLDYMPLFVREGSPLLSCR